MSAITLIQLYEILASKWNKEIAETVTNFIELKTSKEVENNTRALATKEDLANVRTELKTEMAHVRTELKTEMATLRTDVAMFKGELLDRMGKNNTNMIRWMFVFWMGQIAGTIGIILLFVKK